MIAIVCLDDENGMLFNGRRQSRDRVVTERIALLAAGKKLWMNGYSAGLFVGMKPEIQVQEDFLAVVGEKELCFVEDQSLKSFEEKLEKVIVFRWNRKYPADFWLDVELGQWRLAETLEFPGNSHENITQEVYVR